MKKRIILLPLLLLALAACDGGKNSSSASVEPSTPSTDTEPSTQLPSETTSVQDSQTSTTQPTGDLPEDLTHAGTETDPFDVADAIKVAEHVGETLTQAEYYVKGVVVTVNSTGVAQYGNINVDMKDSFESSEKFTAFQITNNGEDFTAETMTVEPGDMITVKGKIYNYKGNTPETEGKGAATMVALQKNAVTVPSDLPDDLTHEGTAADPFDVADAIKVAEHVGDTLTQNEYYIKGLVASVNSTGLTQYGNVNVDMKDSLESEDVFLAFQITNNGEKFTADTMSIEVGDTITVKGKIYNYNGDTPETEGKGATSMVYLIKAAPVSVESVTADAEVEVEVGKVVSLNAKVLPENATDKALIYEVEDDTIAEVTNDKVRGLAQGNTTITIKAHADETKTFTVNVTVVPATIVGDTETATYTIECTREQTEVKDASKILGAIKTDSDVAPVELSNISGLYLGANGGFQDTAFEIDNVLKFGTSKVGGSLTMTFDGSVSISKVVFHMVSWKTTETLTVNGVAHSTTTTFAENCTPEDVEYEFETATNVLELVAANRIVIYGFDITYSK